MQRRAAMYSISIEHLGIIASLSYQIHMFLHVCTQTRDQVALGVTALTHGYLSQELVHSSHELKYDAAELENP